MAENFSNNAKNMLIAPIGVADTTIVVQDASMFPAPDFRVVVDSEYMMVTGISGNVLTVTRAIEGSTAQQHKAGSKVIHVLTAGGLTQIVQETAETVAEAIVQDALDTVVLPTLDGLLKRDGTNAMTGKLLTAFSGLGPSADLDTGIAFAPNVIQLVTNGNVDVEISNGIINANNSRLTNLPAPAANSDAAPKLYVDNLTPAIAFSAYRTASDVFSVTTARKALFNLTAYNVGGYFNTSLARFLPLTNTPRKYLLTCRINILAPAATGQMFCEVWKNGTMLHRGNIENLQAPASGYTTVGGTWFVELNGTTDYVEIYVTGAMAGNKSPVASAAEYYFQGAEYR